MFASVIGGPGACLGLLERAHRNGFSDESASVRHRSYGLGLFLIGKHGELPPSRVGDVGTIAATRQRLNGSDFPQHLGGITDRSNRSRCVWSENLKARSRKGPDCPCAERPTVSGFPDCPQNSANEIWR